MKYEKCEFSELNGKTLIDVKVINECEVVFTTDEK